MNHTANAHSLAYYRIRAVVRFLFWWLTSIFILLCGYAIFDSLRSLADSECDVVISENFTWGWRGSAGDIGDCTHPHNIILNQNFTYEWVQDK